MLDFPLCNFQPFRPYPKGFDYLQVCGLDQRFPSSVVILLPENQITFPYLLQSLGKCFLHVLKYLCLLFNNVLILFGIMKFIGKLSEFRSYFSRRQTPRLLFRLLPTLNTSIADKKNKMTLGVSSNI